MQQQQCFLYKLLRHCCSCIALRVLRFTPQFVTLFPPPSCVRAALLSCTPLRSFLLSFAPFHHVRSTSLLHGRAPQRQTPNAKRCIWDAPPIPQAIPTILTGFHYALSLIHSLHRGGACRAEEKFGWEGLIITLS